MTIPMKKIIDCRNITKSYGDGDMVTQVLKGITFSVDEGEFVAIMGPSGSGKSTLMHILGALDTPTSGEYFLDGKNVAKLSENELADIRMEKIGFVFQSFNLLPRTTRSAECGIAAYLRRRSERESEKDRGESAARFGVPGRSVAISFEPDLRRHDAAGRDRAVAREQSGDDPCRRADGQPGFKDGRDRSAYVPVAQYGRTGRRSSLSRTSSMSRSTPTGSSIFWTAIF